MAPTTPPADFGPTHPLAPEAYLRFERRVRRHQHRVFGFACFLLRDHDEAQDVVQEVLLRLWRHGGTLEEARVLGWLLRVTRNACLDALRRRHPRRDAPDPDRLSAPGLSPAEAAEQADFQDRLLSALEHLAEPYRSIVVLREMQDLTYDEIADTLDLPLNTVKVYLHRGRRMLREQLYEVTDREPA